MSGADRYGESIQAMTRWAEGHNPNDFAEATLCAQLAATAAAVLPMLAPDHPERAREALDDWARLLLPHAATVRRLTSAEWADEQDRQAPTLPMVTGVDGTVRVRVQDLPRDTPELEILVNRAGDGLTPDMAWELGAALLRWARLNREVSW